jgi:hypothetical protein
MVPDTGNVPVTKFPYVRDYWFGNNYRNDMPSADKKIQDQNR